MRSTMSDEQAGRTRPDKKVVADRELFEQLAKRNRNGNGKHLIPPGATSTTTPEGIAAHDPDAVDVEGPAARGSGNGRTHSPAALPMTVSVELKRLEPHPANPRLSYPEQEIADLARSIEEHGLLQPITVRALPGKADAGRYQIVCGHRRYLACKKLGLRAMACNVVKFTDRETLKAMAQENAAREDLNAIELAQMVETLTRSEAEGGAGLTLAEAAAQFGKSESWAENIVRLLALPEPWRGRLAADEIDQTKARVLVPYAAVPRLMQKFDDDWSGDDELALSQCTRKTFTDQVHRIVLDATYGVGETTGRNWFFKGAFVGHERCLVDIEAHRDELWVCKIPVRQGYGPKAKVVHEERVTNLEALERLQAEELTKRDEKKTAREDAKDAKKAKQAKKLTAAQVKAKAADHARILEKRIASWRDLLLRLQCAAEIGDTEGDGPIVTKVLLWYALHSDYRSASQVEDAVALSVGKKKSNPFGPTAWFDVALTAVYKTAHRAVRELLWPSNYEPTDADLPSEMIGRLANDCSITIEAAWGDAQKNKPDGAADLYKRFFELHNKEQLVALGKELGVHIADNASKSVAVQLFTKVPRHLKLPACLKERKKRSKS